MPYGIPRTEEERIAMHESIYGAGSYPPPRGYRVRTTGMTGNSFASDSTVLLLLGAGVLLLLLLGGKK